MQLKCSNKLKELRLINKVLDELIQSVCIFNLYPFLFLNKQKITATNIGCKLSLWFNLQARRMVYITN